MVSGCPFRWLCAHRLGARESLFESRTIGKDASLLDHLATVGVQQAQMAVAVANVDAGGNVVVVGHGRSPPFCGSALDLRSSTCVIVGSARSIISAFSSHLDRGYATKSAAREDG